MSFNEGIQIDPGRASGGGGGRGGIAIGGGLGGIAVLILALVFGVNPNDLLGGGSQAPAPAQTNQFAHCTGGQAANQYVDCRIIATAESLDAVWGQLLPKYGQQYTKPGLRIFNQVTNTGCGQATSDVGPFYCPVDQTAYFDTSFFQVLVDQFGSSGGPLAQEYVVAHEFGHHIQDELGILGRSQQDPQGAQSASVRTELMADCLAGVWAHYASTVPDPQSGLPFLKPLTQNDIRDALSAAAAVGDDRIQRTVQGRVNPEAFTHGTSAQRQHWFSTGYQTGDLNACNTFAARDLG
ncbi:MAG: neutral zinc metallopeptidase [Actinomycetes bacterium]